MISALLGTWLSRRGMAALTKAASLAAPALACLGLALAAHAYASGLRAARDKALGEAISAREARDAAVAATQRREAVIRTLEAQSAAAAASFDAALAAERAAASHAQTERDRERAARRGALVAFSNARKNDETLDACLDVQLPDGFARRLHGEWPGDGSADDAE